MKTKSVAFRPLLKLAWRNIWRQKRRSILLLIVIAYATLTTIFLWGMTDGSNESVLNNQAKLIMAPIIVSDQKYVEDPDPENYIKDLSVTEELMQISGIKSISPRLELPALLRSPYNSQISFIRGIDPALESKISIIPDKIGKGRMLEKPGELILGIKLAQELDVRIGERLAVDASALDGPQALGLQVVGFIDSKQPAVDKSFVLIHIDDAKLLSGVPTATSLAIDVPKGKEKQIAKQINKILPTTMTARDLRTLLGPINNELEANRIQMIPILAIFAIFAAMAVTSTLVVSVLERQREFGMVAAIGLAPKKLSEMVIIESILITFLGWLLGLVLGYGLVWIFATWNILGPLFISASEAFASFGLGDEIYTSIRPIYALYATATIIFAAIFAILIPARRVAKLKPADAMRDS